LEAMPQGGELKIRLQDQRQMNNSILLEFLDHGRGIAPDQMEHIFDPFYTTKEGGTGLGLSIAQKIVDSLGGRIEVESRLGQGTTFRVFFRPNGGAGA
jgi:signal transduction histidine kinase